MLGIIVAFIMLFFYIFERGWDSLVHKNELYSKIVHKLLATNVTIWPNSNSPKKLPSEFKNY